MKKSTILLVAILMILFGCNKNSPSGPEQISVDISGEWKGYLLLDELGNEMTADSTYTLTITQDNASLTSTLIIPEEFGYTSPINLTGEIKNDSTFTLEGNYQKDEIKVYGALKEDHSLETSIVYANDEMHFLIMYKEEDLLTGSYDNTYKLEKKLGEYGNGRSIILVHGMDDNAHSWDKMLNYFDEHGISQTNNVWIFEYKWWRHIEENGYMMAKYVLEAQDNNRLSKDPIIIAHSMGGLVARAYITDDHFDGRQNFYRLVTLSTPHHGSNLAHFVPFGDSDGVGDLIPGHSFLNNLNSNETDIAQRSKYWLLNGRIGTYPSCYVLGKPLCYHWHHPKPTLIEKIGHGRLKKPNDGMVTNASARFDEDDYYETDHNVHRIDTFEWINHSYLNKDTRICKWVTDFIKDHQ